MEAHRAVADGFVYQPGVVALCGIVFVFFFVFVFAFVFVFVFVFLVQADGFVY